MDQQPRVNSKPAAANRLAMGAVAVVAGGLIGVAAGALQAAGWARLGIQSLTVGALLGVVLIGAASSGRLGRPTWRSAALAAVVAVVVQHVWLYSAAIEARREAVAREPAVELFRPGWSDQSFAAYIRSEATRENIALWSLDAALLLAGAVVIVEWSRRRKPAADADD